MEDPKDIIELEVIPPNTKLSINIDTDMYIRIQKCLFEGLALKDFEHFQKCVKEVIAGKMEDPLSEHVYTLILLSNIIEQAAKDQSLIKKTKYDIKNSRIVEDPPKPS
jgi:hypothetical protein